MSVIDLPQPYDPDRERRFVERQGAADAAVDWSSVRPEDRPPHIADRAIELWADQQIATLGQQHGDAVATTRERIADLVADGDRREGEAEQSRAQESAAGRERDRLTAILTGDRRGPDEGRWADPARMSEKVWLAVLVTSGVYGAASTVDIGLNFLAFQVMGVSPAETLVLAAGVVLVTVLLPKQIGETLEAHRRGARRSPRRMPLLVAGVLLWIGVSLFTALIRTNYLLFPIAAGTSAQRPSLAAQAGVGPVVLVLGWLAVAVAVGLVVLFHAMRRYNPYVRPWRNAERTVRRRHSETVQLRWESDRTSQQLRAARAELDAVDRARERAVAACRAFAAELRQIYRSSYLRALGSPERRRPDDPPAIEPSQEWWS